MKSAIVLGVAVLVGVKLAIPHPAPPKAPVVDQFAGFHAWQAMQSSAVEYAPTIPQTSESAEYILSIPKVDMSWLDDLHSTTETTSSPGRVVRQKNPAQKRGTSGSAPRSYNIFRGKSGGKPRAIKVPTPDRSLHGVNL